MLAAAGDDVRVYRTPLATYLLSCDALVILLEPGDRPDGTGVRDALHVAVTPPLPDEIHTLLYQDLVYGSGWPDRPSVLRVEGYVRLAAGCLPLGPLRMAGGSYDPGSEGLRERTFRLDTALPFGLLDRVRSAVAPGPVPQVPTVEWLRLLPHDPVGALREFVDAWYAGVRPVVGPHQAAATPLPTALAVLHGAIAGRRELLGRQDFLRTQATVAELVPAGDRAVRGHGHRELHDVGPTLAGGQGARTQRPAAGSGAPRRPRCAACAPGVRPQPASGAYGTPARSGASIGE